MNSMNEGPTIILKFKEIKLIRYRNKENTFYAVDISNNSIGMTVYMSKDLNRVKEIFDKEKYYNPIQKSKDEDISRLKVNSIYGQAYDKCLIADEEIFGRRSTLIKYFNNELAHIDEYFGVEELDKREESRKRIEETLKELKLPDTKNDLEPLVLQLHPINKTFHIVSQKEQINKLQGLYEQIEKAKEKDEEEEEYE